jgi:hypothetical protein
MGGEMTFDLVGALSAAIASEREEWDKNGRIYASDLGTSLEDGPCALAFRQKCENAPRAPKLPGQLLMLKVGDLLHGYIQWLLPLALEGSGWEVLEIEDKVELFVDDEGIGARLDILLRDPDGRLVVLDVKTKRGNAFRYLEEPKVGDVLQVQSYITGKDAHYGGILYVDREGQNFMRHFWVDRDDKAVQSAVRTLQAYRDAEKPPAPVGLRLRVRENKGPDSVYLDIPWQIEWCDLQTCACRAALPGSPPDGIVAKVDEENGLYSIDFTDIAKGWEAVIFEMLRAEYPSREWA